MKQRQNAADQTLHCSSWPAGEFQEIVQRSMPALSTSRVDSIFMRPALSGWKLSISAPSRTGPGVVLIWLRNTPAAFHSARLAEARNLSHQSRTSAGAGRQTAHC